MAIHTASRDDSHSDHVKFILVGPDETRKPEKDSMTCFWESVMTEPNNNTPGLYYQLKQDLGRIWEPISPDEVNTKLPGNSSAPGIIVELTGDLHCCKNLLDLNAHYQQPTRSNSKLPVILQLQTSMCTNMVMPHLSNAFQWFLKRYAA